MSPLPALTTLGDARVHVGSPDSGYVLAEIKGVINEGFGLHAIL